MLSRPLSGDFTIRFMHYYIHSCTINCYLCIWNFRIWNFHYHIHQGSKHFCLAGNMASSTSTPFAALWQSAAERTRIFELLARLICLKLMRLLFRNLDPRLVLDIVFTSYRLIVLPLYNKACPTTTRLTLALSCTRKTVHMSLLVCMTLQNTGMQKIRSGKYTFWLLLTG